MRASISTSAVSCTAATKMGILGIHQHASTVRKTTLIGWSLEFNGVTGSAVPVMLELQRVTALGTATAATTGVWQVPTTPTPGTVGQRTYTVNPALGNVLETHYVHPQSGMYVMYPMGREPELFQTANYGLVLFVTAPAVVLASASLIWEE